MEAGRPAMLLTLIRLLGAMDLTLVDFYQATP
jgi:hypothetical protein